jgi:hypothetical protein
MTPSLGGIQMKKLVYAFAMLAAAASTAAMAKDVKQDKKVTAPAVAATQMTESEMDKVTAGTVTGQGPDQTVLLPATAQGTFRNLIGNDHSDGRAANLCTSTGVCR